MIKAIEQYTLKPVLKGKVIEAQYDNEQVVNGYTGNPLIEALSKIMDEDELGLLRTIRHGYVARNPLQGESAQKYHVRFENRVCVNKKWDHVEVIQSTAAGYYIIDVSGQGKSPDVDLNLLLYPQVIHHTCYNKQPLIMAQLVWLKLNCPVDGSIKGLCINFFQAVDALLGTTYFKKLVTRGSIVDALIHQMARVATTHCLGALVIDDIQNLSQAKSSSSEKMLIFFKQLNKTIGVPIVLVDPNGEN